MHNFYFAGHSLSEFAGRIAQAPSHQIAQRDFEFVEIPGRSGDLVQDNGRYNNVSFSLQIYFLPFLSKQTAKQLAYAVIDWLGAFNGYQEYRDSYNPGYYTKAIITNFETIIRELPTFLSTTIQFSRVPFWYRLDGRNEIELPYGSYVRLNNPEPLVAEPTVFYTQASLNSLPALTINSKYVGLTGTKSDYVKYELNLIEKFYKGYDSNGIATHISPLLPPELPSGENILRSFTTPTYGTFSIVPHWRRL